MSKLKTTVNLGVGAGGAISSVCGLVADFFMPVAPYGIYLGFAGLILLLLSLGLFFIPAIDRRLGQIMGDSWYLPSFALLSIFTISMFGFYYMGKNAPGNNGYLVGHFDELSRLQTDILISTKAIEQNTANISVNTREIADTVKKETSDDPRKELANRGIEWNQANLVDAIIRGEVENIQLFAKGKMFLDEDSKLRVINGMSDNGISQFEQIQDLYPINFLSILSISYVDLYEFDMDPDNVFGIYVESYLERYKNQQLDEYNQKVSLEREKFLNDNLEYVKKLRFYLADFLKVRVNGISECSVKLKTLNRENSVLLKVVDIDTLKKYLNFDGRYFRSLTLNSIDFALDDLIAYCPAFSHTENLRPIRPDLLQYTLEEKQEENFFIQEPQVDKVSIPLVGFTNLVNANFYKYLISTGTASAFITQLHLSNGEIIDIHGESVTGKRTTSL